MYKYNNGYQIGHMGICKSLVSLDTLSVFYFYNKKLLYKNRAFCTKKNIDFTYVHKNNLQKFLNLRS